MRKSLGIMPGLVSALIREGRLAKSYPTGGTAKECKRDHINRISRTPIYTATEKEQLNSGGACSIRNVALLMDRPIGSWLGRRVEPFIVYEVH